MVFKVSGFHQHTTRPIESNVSFKESLSHTFPVFKPKNSVVTSVNVRKGRANLETGNSGDERAGQIS